MGLGKILKGALKVAAPFAGFIPGVGPLAAQALSMGATAIGNSGKKALPAMPAVSAGLGVGADLLRGGEQRKAEQRNRTIQEGNVAEYEKRYQTGRGDAKDELARMIAENDSINADMATQRGAYNDDVRSSRAGATQTIEGLLNEVRNSGVDIKDAPDVQEFGYQDQVEGADATYQDQAYQEDNSDAAVLRDRAAARGMQGRDAVEAAQLQRQMMTEAGQQGPSADALSGLLAKAGGSAITRSFEDSGNRAAMELSRTGGNSANTFANLARERSEALKGNDVNAALAGMQGAEDLAGARAQRLNPMIAALSARATASPDASAEMQGMAIRGQAKQANQSMNMQGRQNVQQMNMNKGIATKQMNVQGRGQNNATNAVIRGDNATNKLTSQGQRVSQASTRAGQLAAMAPAAMAPYSMRTLAPTARSASGGLSTDYMRTGVGQNQLVSETDNTGSGILQGLGDMADLAGRSGPETNGLGETIPSYDPANVSTPSTINARAMFEKAQGKRLKADYTPAKVTTPSTINAPGMFKEALGKNLKANYTPAKVTAPKAINAGSMLKKANRTMARR